MKKIPPHMRIKKHVIHNGTFINFRQTGALNDHEEGPFPIRVTCISLDSPKAITREEYIITSYGVIANDPVNGLVPHFVVRKLMYRTDQITALASLHDELAQEVIIQGTRPKKIVREALNVLTEVFFDRAQFNSLFKWGRPFLVSEY